MQQTTSADVIFQMLFILCALRVNTDSYKMAWISLTVTELETKKEATIILVCDIVFT